MITGRVGAAVRRSSLRTRAGVATVLLCLPVAATAAFAVGDRAAAPAVTDVPPAPATSAYELALAELDLARPRPELMFTAVTAAGAVIALPPPAVSTRPVPSTVYTAYRRAAAVLAAENPSCHLSWSLLAGVGQVESGQASGGRVDATGRTAEVIIGPALDGGPGMARITDTDGGVLDGDAVYDHAVGPMQFIPSTWRYAGADGNADGIRDPHNIADAALAAGRYLCAGGGDLRRTADLRAAVLTYNQSQAYVDLVLAYATAFATGRPFVQPTPVSPDAGAPVPPPTAGPTATGSPTATATPTGTPGPTASPGATPTMTPTPVTPTPVTRTPVTPTPTRPTTTARPSPSSSTWARPSWATATPPPTTTPTATATATLTATATPTTSAPQPPPSP